MVTSRTASASWREVDRCHFGLSVCMSGGVRYPRREVSGQREVFTFGCRRPSSDASRSLTLQQNLRLGPGLAVNKLVRPSGSRADTPAQLAVTQTGRRLLAHTYLHLHRPRTDRQVISISAHSLNEENTARGMRSEQPPAVPETPHRYVTQHTPRHDRPA
ncbi:hypothetical protein ElyMa_001063900 [Elysia marginata]|uniref:Uncharacterized protein n=1 Tax=Elysia marginata TaxID=1093978 RepID=A0AAV4HUB1_9GAST|nr:hypothetical protein ElyMa_001063900 [Elysia marginata]